MVLRKAEVEALQARSKAEVERPPEAIIPLAAGRPTKREKGASNTAAVPARPVVAGPAQEAARNTLGTRLAAATTLAVGARVAKAVTTPMAAQTRLPMAPAATSRSRAIQGLRSRGAEQRRTRRAQAGP